MKAQDDINCNPKNQHDCIYNQIYYSMKYVSVNILERQLKQYKSKLYTKICNELSDEFCLYPPSAV